MSFLLAFDSTPNVLLSPHNTFPRAAALVGIPAASSLSEYIAGPRVETSRGLTSLKLKR